MSDGQIIWIDVAGEITSADGNYNFVDDGSLSGGNLPVKLHRVLLIK